MMATISLAGHRFEPDLSGALWWPERETLPPALVCARCGDAYVEETEQLSLQA